MNNTTGNNTLAFSLMNGTYSFAIPDVFIDGQLYAPSPSRGAVVVNGTNLTQDVSFAPVYQVEFNETGLPNSTFWTTQVVNTSPSWSSVTDSLPNTSLVFMLGNGSYNFTVANSTYNGSVYSPAASNGSIVVNGTNLSIGENFSISGSQYPLQDVCPGVSSPHSTTCPGSCVNATSGPPSIVCVEVADWDETGLTTQANVTWAVAGNVPLQSESFRWKVKSASTNLRLPDEWQNQTVIGYARTLTTEQLDALSAGTTYAFQIRAAAYYNVTIRGHTRQELGHAKYTSAFSTAPAPDTRLVGLVSNLTSDPYEIDPVGSPIRGATIFLEAYCYDPAAGGNYRTFFNLSTTNSTGWYQSPSYPLSSDEYGGPYSLTATGLCNTYNPGGSPGYTVSNSHVLLTAETPTDFWAYDWISSRLSASNDYERLGLLPNIAEAVPVGTAYVHGGAEASCSFTYGSATQSSTITQDVGINSYSGTDVVVATGLGYNSPGGFGDDNALNLMDVFTGIVNETTGKPVIETIFPTGQEQGPNANPVRSSDGVSLISVAEYPPNQELPHGWHEAFPNPGQTEDSPLSYNVYSSGQYISTSGISDNLSVSVGWGGFSVSDTVSILATTSISTSLNATASCAFAYPGNDTNGGAPFYYYFTGEPTDASVAAPIVDVWFMGYCGGTHGEPAC